MLLCIWGLGMHMLLAVFVQAVLAEAECVCGCVSFFFVFEGATQVECPRAAESPWVVTMCVAANMKMYSSVRMLLVNVTV